MMTRLRDHERARRPHAVWAWTAIWLTPLLLATALLASFVGEGAGRGLGGVTVAVACLAGPTVAVIFSVAAMHADEPTGRTALYVSVPLFLVIAGLLPVLLVSFVSWSIALGGALGVVGVFLTVNAPFSGAVAHSSRTGRSAPTRRGPGP